MYSQMRFQLSQSHTLTAKGLKSGKKSINWVSLGILETLRDLKIKATDFKFSNNITNSSYLMQFDICQTYHFQVTGQNI